MYWPACAVAIAPTTGRYSTATIDIISQGAKTLLQAINSQAASSFGSGSRVVNTSKVGAGRMAAVDRVLIGNRPDHQERRENSIPEAYFSQSF